MTGRGRTWEDVGVAVRAREDGIKDASAQRSVRVCDVPCSECYLSRLSAFTTKRSKPRPFSARAC